MIKNSILAQNHISFANYFIIKKDRAKINIEILRNTRTFKILSAKANGSSNVNEIVNWIKNYFENVPILIIPFPSTNKKKSVIRQLPFLLADKLCKINKKWENGSGLLTRKYSLPKNTRNIKKQYESLIIINPERIRGKNILILDDVTTTGSSLKAAIKLIKKEKPSDVKGFAVAKKVFLKDIPLSGIY